MSIPVLSGKLPIGIGGCEAGCLISTIASGSAYVPGGSTPPTTSSYFLQGIGGWRQSGKQVVFPYYTRPSTPYPDMIQSGLEPSTFRLAGTWYRGNNPFLKKPSFKLGQQLIVRLIVVNSAQSDGPEAALGYTAICPVATVAGWDIAAEVDGKAEWVFDLTATWNFQDFSGNLAGATWLGGPGN